MNLGLYALDIAENCPSVAILQARLASSPELTEHDIGTHKANLARFVHPAIREYNGKVHENETPAGLIILKKAKDTYKEIALKAGISNAEAETMIREDQRFIQNEIERNPPPKPQEELRR